MGRFLLDTNAVIYLQKELLAEPLPTAEYFISVITEMELLSFAVLGVLELPSIPQRRVINNPRLFDS